MRRWLADRLRLALRKVLPRLVAFAFVPTRKEMDALVARMCAQAFDSLIPGSSKPEDRQRLH